MLSVVIRDRVDSTGWYPPSCCSGDICIPLSCNSLRRGSRVGLSIPRHGGREKVFIHIDRLSVHVLIKVLGNSAVLPVAYMKFKGATINQVNMTRLPICLPSFAYPSGVTTSEKA